MRPSSKQLLNSITWSLDQRVAPLLDDKWGLSTLRSVRCLIEHLGVRVESEGQVLFDDNADLNTLAIELGPTPATQLDAGARFQTVCAQSWREIDVYPTLESLAEENDAKRTALESLIRQLDSPLAEGLTGVDEVLELIDAYLQRQLQRDQPMFLPFMGSTF